MILHRWVGGDKEHGGEDCWCSPVRLSWRQLAGLSFGQILSLQDELERVH